MATLPKVRPSHVLTTRVHPPTIVVSSARKAKEVLKTHGLVFANRPLGVGQRKLSYNGKDLAFQPFNDVRRELSKICTLQLFSSKNVQSFRSIREYEVSRMIERISELVSDTENVINLSEIVMAFTSTIITRIYFGKSAGTHASIIWAMTALMKKPKVMMKALKQVRDLIRNKGFVNEDDLSYIPFLKAIVKETLRLYPPSPLLLMRQTTEACVIDGYEIPARTLAFVNAWAIGRDPEAWVDPEEFWPERFIGNSGDFKGLDYMLIQFGEGRRSCPGANMGVITVELALANLLYSFDWELPSGMSKEEIDTDVKPGLTMHKKTPLCIVPTKHCLIN